MADAKRDNNRKVTLMGVTDNAALTPTNLIVDPTSKRLKVSATISGGLFQYDATVGATGADYTTLAAAVADSKVNILVINTTTEVVNTALLANTVIYIKTGATVTMGVRQITSAGAVILTIKGEGTFAWAHTSTAELFAGTAGSSSIIDGVTLTNTSTVTDCPWSFLKERVTNVVVNLPNADEGGFESNVDNCFYSNILFVGGGTTCSQAFRVGSGQDTTATNIIFSGTFVTGDKSGTDIKSVAYFDDHAIASNFYFHTAAAVDIEVGANANLSNFNSFDDLSVVFDGNQISLNNFRLNAGDLLLVATDQNKISNVQTTGLINVSNAGATNNSINNCRWTGATTVAGLRNKFTNCDILGGVSVSSGADDNGFVNCQVGADAGAGALTIVVVAGSNRTRIVGCMTDSALSDSGTGTVTAGNTVY